MAKWRETLVAVKLLLNTGVNLDDMEAAAELAISLSNPILHNLQQVRCARCALGGGGSSLCLAVPGALCRDACAGAHCAVVPCAECELLAPGCTSHGGGAMKLTLLTGLPKQLCAVPVLPLLGAHASSQQSAAP
jgi:hypothetical protein